MCDPGRSAAIPATYAWSHAAWGGATAGTSAGVAAGPAASASFAATTGGTPTSVAATGHSGHPLGAAKG